MALTETLYGALSWQAIARMEGTANLLCQHGIESRMLRTNGVPVNLYDVFDRSLLGENPDQQRLSEREQLLLKKENPHIVSVVDFDGVFCNPYKVACEYLGRHDAEARGNLNLPWLSRVARRSNPAIVWTNRILLTDALLEKNLLARLAHRPFAAPIDRFPFIDESSITRLEKLGRGNLAVIPQKWSPDSLEIMRQLLPEDFDMLYFVGSSGADCRALLQLVEAAKLDKASVVHFDTGHWLL